MKELFKALLLEAKYLSQGWKEAKYIIFNLTKSKRKGFVHTKPSFTPTLPFFLCTAPQFPFPLQSSVLSLMDA